MIYLILKREWLLYYRKRMELLNPLFFFFLIASLFPLAIGPNPTLLTTIAPGIIWLAALLANLLALPYLFRDHYYEGTLVQLLLSERSTALLISAKLLMQWLMINLPLLICAPLLMLLFHLPYQAGLVLWLTLLLGTPILTLLGGMIAALTVSLPNAGLLMSLVLLPLYVPVLIFATSAITTALQGLPVMGSLLWLSCLLALSLTCLPLAAAFGLRLGMAGS